MSWVDRNKEKASILSPFFRKLKQDPIKALDSLELKGHGYCFNSSRFEVGIRKAFLTFDYIHVGKRRIAVPSGLIVLACILWALQGWDSSPHQISNFLNGLPDFLAGRIDWATLSSYYFNAYGCYEHYSAFVIYGLYYWMMSKHLSDLGIVKLKNILITAGLVAIPIGVFEIFWCLSYYFFQGQAWILTFQWPQLRIILQNLILMPLVGGLALILVDWKTYELNFDWKTFLYLDITIGLILLWWFYGDWLPIQIITVPVEGFGNWVSSIHFPQTVYTIDTNILDNLAVGEQFWIQNDLLHLVNTITKVFLTLAAYSILKLKRR